MAGKTPGAQPAAALEPETPSAKSTVSPKKSVKAPKGKQKSAAVVPKVSAPILPQQATSSTRQIPLDSRWSVIPAAQYNSAMSALISCIPKTAVLPMNDSTTKSLTIAPTTAPSHSSTLQRRRAVALDCEMVRIGHNISELARLSAIDYLTGEILIDTLVRPLHAVTDWRTQWSGVTAQAMNAAVASGTALQGAPEARTQLFTFVDTETVLVGHALHHDLAALGICHQNVVDSAALASKAVAMGARKQWGLQALCAELLTLSVQGHGSQGHDSVEDALAAREVVLWSLRNPGPLKAWGKRKKMEMLEEDRLRKARRDAKRLARAPRIEYTYPDPWDYSDASGVYDVSLRELNEMCGYPVWYDNWSD
ncbi:uncharacterized protein EKO05_0003950 [Ascochyta rabiei]|nr:uncharacterized protein EKO05_0003950 [Ascochyta rabiei]UPX13442.1 hypothetical protein EKO05_0003950 [Ascochyta rabiei]